MTKIYSYPNFCLDRYFSLTHSFWTSIFIITYLSGPVFSYSYLFLDLFLMHQPNFSNKSNTITRGLATIEMYLVLTSIIWTIKYNQCKVFSIMEDMVQRVHSEINTINTTITIKQAGAELCQAQGKLRLVGFW